MANFTTAQNKVKRLEGGYSEDPRDPGNWTGGRVNTGVLIGTNHGISAPVLAAYLGHTPTAWDMKNLAYDTSLSIYKKDYWDKIGGDKLKDQSVAELIYDMAVNQGLGATQKIVSDSLGTRVTVPFIKDTEKINAANQQQLFNTIKQKRKDVYQQIGGYALNGWMNRLNSFVYEHRTGIGIALLLIGMGAFMILYSTYNVPLTT